MPNKLSIAESRVLESIQNAAFDVPGVVPSARGLSHLGEHALGWLGSAALGASLDKKRREDWIRIGAAAFTAHAASVVLKRIVRRKRPDYSYVRVGVKTPSRLSFPSSRATSTTAFLVGLSRLTGSKVPLMGVPVMMASRMVLGVHYPTDTVAGAAIGAATARAMTKEKDA